MEEGMAWRSPAAAMVRRIWSPLAAAMVGRSPTVAMGAARAEMEEEELPPEEEEEKELLADGRRRRGRRERFYFLMKLDSR